MGYLTISKARYTLRLMVLEEEHKHPFLKLGLLNHLFLNHEYHVLHLPELHL